MAGPLILVTGASQGIGAAIASAFAKQLPGVRLALVARTAGKLRAVALKCRRADVAEVEVFPCDVSDPAAVAAMAAAVTARFGTPDALVNNAGNFTGASFLETTLEAWESSWAANARSVFLVSKAFVPAMVERKSGTVFNMSSIAGIAPYPGGAAYCTAKYAVTGLTKVMRAELRDKGVRVIGVYPGATWSPSWQHSGVSAERIMPAEDVAQVFVDTWKLGPRTVVEDIVLRPQLGDL